MIAIRRTPRRCYVLIGLLIMLYVWPVGAASAAEQQKARGYTYNLRQLVEKAKRNIKKIDAKLSKKASEKK